MKKFLDKSQLIGITEASEIAFNLDAFDYLIIHELSHYFYHNHQTEF